MSKNAAYIQSVQDHLGNNPEKFYKTTLFQEKNLMIGLNCFEPGQAQKVHQHDDQDKFYYVIEGEGHFTIGAEVVTAGPGHVIWAPAGLPHGVENQAGQRLTVLMGIAPGPK